MAKTRISIPLHYQIIIALIAGGFFGYFFSPASSYTNWIGDIFLRALNMIIIPLILASVMTGVANVGSSGNQKTNRQEKPEMAFQCAQVQMLLR